MALGLNGNDQRHFPRSQEITDTVTAIYVVLTGLYLRKLAGVPNSADSVVDESNYRHAFHGMRWIVCGTSPLKPSHAATPAYGTKGDAQLCIVRPACRVLRQP